MAQTQQPKVSDIILMASGGVMILTSFLAWFGEGRFKISAWTSDVDGLGSFPLFTYAPLFGLAIAALTAARVFGGMNLPDNLIGLSLAQWIRALSIFSVLLLVGIFILGEDAKIGLILNLLGAIGLVVGSFLADQEAGSAASAPPAPPTPF